MVRDMSAADDKLGTLLSRGDEHEQLDVVLMLRDDADAAVEEQGKQLMQRAAAVTGESATEYNVLPELGVVVVSGSRRLIRHLVTDPVVSRASPST
jgi:uncharacterized protein (DUF4213/DUF364 family)